jgi:hypothetical protein
MTDDNDYQLEQARSAEAMAVKLGIEQQILYAENDAVTQSTQLFKMIHKGEPRGGGSVRVVEEGHETEVHV